MVHYLMKTKLQFLYQKEIIGLQSLAKMYKTVLNLAHFHMFLVDRQGYDNGD